MELTNTEIPPYRPHTGPYRQYMRDIVLGVNDGLVSILLLVAGVVGGGFTSPQVLLAGIAASLAGAVSMAAGEYIATKSQEEVFTGEMELEREHFLYYRDNELDELREMFGGLGLEGELLESVVTTIGRDDDALLKVMMALEFGVVETERRSPLRAMLTSGLLFLAGSLPPIIPFMFDPTPTGGLVVAAILSGIAVFGVGVAKTIATRTSPLLSGIENLGVASLGAVFSYGVGDLYQRLVS